MIARTSCFLTAAMAALVLSATSANAVLIHEWNFDDGTINDSAGSLDLTATTNNPPHPVLGGASYHSDGDNTNFLSAPGPGGVPDFTVSIWTKTHIPNQGGFNGIFSNNTSSAAAFSWQVASDDGDYVLASQGNPAFNIGSVSPNRWEHLVIQKFGGNDGRAFLNGVQVGGDFGFNIGGLQNYRLGINRNSDQSFEGLIDNVQVFDDSTTSPAALFAAGPGPNAFNPIAFYEFGGNGSGSFDRADTAGSPLATVTDLINGGGLGSKGNAFGSTLPKLEIEGDDIPNDGSGYLEFTVNPTGKPIKFEGMDFIYQLENQASSGGFFVNFDLFSSLDGFADPIDDFTTINLAAGGGFTGFFPADTFDLSGLASTDSPVTFRLFLQDGSGLSTKSIRIDDLVVTGNAVPEPGGLVLGLLGAAGLAARRRRGAC